MKIRLDTLKEPDLWTDIKYELSLSDEQFDNYFEYGDYAAIELEVDQDLKIVGGYFIPLRKQN